MLFILPCTHSSYRTKAVSTEGLSFSDTVCLANWTTITTHTVLHLTNRYCCLLRITGDKFHLHARLQEGLNTLSDKWTGWVADPHQAHIHQVL